MKTYHSCLSCFVEQALGLLRRSEASGEQVKEAMRTVFLHLAEIDLAAPPPVMAGKINKIVCAAVGATDPYAEEKQRFNSFAQRLLPQMRSRIPAGHDGFIASLKLAIAANIIDFGQNRHLTEAQVQSSFERVFEAPIDEAAALRLQQAGLSAQRVLYLCDNAGEIVFDRFLIEQMPHGNTTCAVRGGPVINDATLEDAREAGLLDLVDVISNGSDVPGTSLTECTAEFARAFDAADVIIAKGQGNFETLSEVTHKRIFYLLQVKCPVIGRDVGAAVGTLLIRDNQPEVGFSRNDRA
jgi:uncharacterized protein with ATP-grasp and redox domains